MMIEEAAIDIESKTASDLVAMGVGASGGMASWVLLGDIVATGGALTAGMFLWSGVVMGLGGKRLAVDKSIQLLRRHKETKGRAERIVFLKKVIRHAIDEGRDSDPTPVQARRLDDFSQDIQFENDEGKLQKLRDEARQLRDAIIGK